MININECFLFRLLLEWKKKNKTLTKPQKKVVLYLSLKRGLLSCSIVAQLTKLLKLKGKGRLPLNRFPLSRGLPYPNLVRLLEPLNHILISNVMSALYF